MRLALVSRFAKLKMPRSPRLAHKAPVIQATYTTTQIDNAKAVPLASQLCELRARVLLALLSLRKNEGLLVAKSTEIAIV